jgi:hypothetical protein
MGQVEQRLEELGLELPGEVQCPAPTWRHHPIPVGARPWQSGVRVGAWRARCRRVSAWPVREGAERGLARARAGVGSVGDACHVGELEGRHRRPRPPRGLADCVRERQRGLGYAQTTLVVNPAFELLLDLYGADAGAHARTAIGMSALPLNVPVILAAEVELAV